MIAKRNARVAAVQVIFQYFFSRKEIKKIIRDYETLNDDSLKKKFTNFDKKLFEKIIVGVCENETKIKPLIEKNLSEKWPYERVDLTFRIIFQ